MIAPRTAVPYPQFIDGFADDVRYRCYFAHPPEKLTQRMIKTALFKMGKEPINAALKSLPAYLPRHSHKDILLKLGAINSLANAKSTAIPRVAVAMKRWESARNMRLSRLIKEGRHKDATDLMLYVSETASTATSLLSKYLSYHDERWMIYDSYVRCYVFAMLQGVLAGRSPDKDPPPIRSLRELKQYDEYCHTVEWVWQRLSLKAPATARKREAVFWYRAKHCRVINPRAV